MKILKKLLALTLVLALAALCGCKDRNNLENEASEDMGTLLSRQEESSIPETPSNLPPLPPPASEPEESEGEESGPETSELSRPGELSDVEVTDESVAAAMSTDYAALSALSSEEMPWGSGGPTDDRGRPNGATVYQERYGKYDAYFIHPDSEKIYLTFDEGYEYGFTPAILDTLKEKDVKAVFFITSHFAKSQPDLVRRMIDEGHIVGNHSTAHKAYPSLPLSEAGKDLWNLHEYVKQNFGYEMTLFRFPEGKFSEQTLALAQSLGYKSLFWSFAYMDYDVNKQPLSIDALDKIVSKVHPGGLYLLHAVSRTNSEVLGEAIDLLRAQGYTLAQWDII